MSPNECVCMDGYLKNTNGICEPVCLEPCINGTCAAPNQCNYDPNFRILQAAVTSEPKCDPLCNQGKCIATNTCECFSGYEFKNDSRTNCIPICQTPCEHGTCIGPNECRCFMGYQISDDDTTCEPVCFGKKGCDNGYCVEPNVCECDTDYTLSTTTGKCIGGGGS